MTTPEAMLLRATRSLNGAEARCSKRGHQTSLLALLAIRLQLRETTRELSGRAPQRTKQPTSPKHDITVVHDVLAKVTDGMQVEIRDRAHAPIGPDQKMIQTLLAKIRSFAQKVSRRPAAQLFGSRMTASRSGNNCECSLNLLRIQSGAHSMCLSRS